MRGSASRGRNPRMGARTRPADRRWASTYPDCKRLRNMRVLNRAAMPRDAFPSLAHRALESQREETRMLQHARHRRSQRAELQYVATAKRGRWWAIFGAHTEVALA